MLDAMIVSRLSMDWELILIGALPGKIWPLNGAGNAAYTPATA